MLIILATQEEEIRRITVQSQLKQIVLKTLSQNRASGVAQGKGPDFKPQYCNNNNNNSLVL
jgi:hypothetical protein